LRRECPGARVVLADPLGSGLAEWVETGIAGQDTGYLIEGIGAGAPPAVLERSAIDTAERIPDAESFATVGRLLREEGLLVGGSAGTAVAAAVRVAAAGGIDGPVVVLLPDSWDRYLSTAWLRAL
jgi:cysteine synthase